VSRGRDCGMPTESRPPCGCVALDELIPLDHQVRIVWEYVDGLDLSLLLSADSGNRSAGGGSGHRSADSHDAVAVCDVAGHR